MYTVELFNNVNERPVITFIHHKKKTILKHWHPEIEITFMFKSSKLALHINNNEFMPQSGDVFFINPFEIHGVEVFGVPDYLEEEALTIIIPTNFIKQYCPFFQTIYITKTRIGIKVHPFYN